MYFQDEMVNKRSVFVFIWNRHVFVKSPNNWPRVTDFTICVLFIFLLLYVVEQTWYKYMVYIRFWDNTRNMWSIDKTVQCKYSDMCERDKATTYLGIPRWAQILTVRPTINHSRSHKQQQHFGSHVDLLLKATEMSERVKLVYDINTMLSSANALTRLQTFCYFEPKHWFIPTIAPSDYADIRHHWVKRIPFLSNSNALIFLLISHDRF